MVRQKVRTQFFILKKKSHGKLKVRVKFFSKNKQTNKRSKNKNKKQAKNTKNKNKKQNKHDLVRQKVYKNSILTFEQIHMVGNSILTFHKTNKH